MLNELYNSVRAINFDLLRLSLAGLMLNMHKHFVKISFQGLILDYG